MSNTGWYSYIPAPVYSDQGRWGSLYRGNSVARVGSTITIPIFSKTNDVAGWLGASFISCRFDYSVSLPFSIDRLPTKPASPNYCPIISYFATATQRKRYKLWSGVNEKVFAPLYNGEKIGTNFAIEIWTTQGNNSVSNAAIITLNIGIQNIPVDCSPDAIPITAPSVNNNIWSPKVIPMSFVNAYA